MPVNFVLTVLHTYVSLQAVHVSTSISFRLVWDYVPPNSSTVTGMDSSQTQYRPDLVGASGEEDEGEGEAMDVLSSDVINANEHKEPRAR